MEAYPLPPRTKILLAVTPDMFTLLGDIRSHSGYRKIPILCVLGSRGRALTDVAIEGLDHAVKALRANGFLDLQHIARATGDDSIVSMDRRRKTTV